MPAKKDLLKEFETLLSSDSGRAISLRDAESDASGRLTRTDDDRTREFTITLWDEFIRSKLSKSALARRMKTSRSAVDRLFDPDLVGSHLVSTVMRFEAAVRSDVLKYADSCEECRHSAAQRGALWILSQASSHGGQVIAPIREIVDADWFELDPGQKDQAA